MRYILLSVLLLQAFTGFCQNSYNQSKGIITTGSGYEMRSFAGFNVPLANALHYPEAINMYKDKMPDVRIYSMVIPTAVQFYCPDEYRSRQKDQAEIIAGMYEHLQNVIPVNVEPVLSEHANEAIYSRTDHHWQPLGAYYAAQVFAEIADVPFLDLSEYDQKFVHNFCGTMPKFGGDQRLKNYPEEFIYYTPKDTDYVTTYVQHNPSKTKGVYTLSKPFKGPFFQSYKDGSIAAYSTFMAGDSRTTHVECFGDNGRKLMIIKDSFGNALPGYLFYSFSDIYVVDFRYFQKNIVDYVRENGITDILFANNISHACSKNTSSSIIKMLTK